MKRLRIVHTTAISYDGEVSTSYNEARMLPVGTERQLVLSAQLDVRPAAHQASYLDYWGTRVTAFDVLSPHREITIAATSLVEVSAGSGLAGLEDVGWQAVRDRAAGSMTAAEHSGQTRRTEPTEEILELAAEAVAVTTTPDEAALEICHRVGSAMEYLQGVTGVHSTAAEAWAERRGVCQDIAHVAVGALRGVGIPARYVSGYMHPQLEPEVGTAVRGESHAWVEWLTGGWRSFDPTNLCPVGDRHVLVARGRDYDDVAPFRGVYAGPDASRMEVTVEITRER